MRDVMTEGTEIFQQYADHLAKRAASVVVSLAVVGAVGGALLAAVPGLLGHSVISPGANYFLVLLGAIAGAITGRSFGEKRAVGIRFQAQTGPPPGKDRGTGRRRTASVCSGSRCRLLRLLRLPRLWLCLRRLRQSRWSRSFPRWSRRRRLSFRFPRWSRPRTPQAPRPRLRFPCRRSLLRPRRRHPPPPRPCAARLTAGPRRSASG